MCGIAGFLGSPDRTLLEAMRSEIEHRGPDQRGVFESPECSFAHVRLSIIDLSEAGKQPMVTPDGRYTVVYNGEIYNHLELREKYASEGWVFQSGTDTECILASASLHGLEDIGFFHGMFAFAVWDRDTKTCFFSRDRLGIKPLFYAERDGRLYVASEIPAILSASDSWNVNADARSAYFSLGYVPGPQTIAKGVLSFLPGRLYVYCDGKLEEHLRFDVSSVASLSSSRSEVVNELRDRLDRVVKQQLVADREVGCFLSGGVDSSAVLASVRIAKPGIRMKTFTTKFRHNVDDPKFNLDAEIAKKTAEKYECEHHEIEVGTEDMIREAEEIARHMGQPHGNHSVVALDAVARLASSSVTVVLSGDGGDEVFGGYDRYREYARVLSLLRFRFVWKIVRVVLRFHKKYPQWEDFLSAPDELGRFLAMHASPKRFLSRMFDSSVIDANASHRLLKNVREDIRSIQDPVSRFMAFDRAVWLRDDAFSRSDRLTMRHGLELRVPLTDDSLLDFATSVPRTWLVNRHETKSLWKEAVGDRCLPEVFSAKKRGWFPPTAKWIRDDLHDWTEGILEEAIRDHSWMNGKAIREMFKDHCEHRGYFLNEIWNIVGYQLWWRQYGGKMVDSLICK